ncbi:MAG TPA: hypothetical protein VJ824_10555 [Bacillota bacterium]|nr:hypothetical protein [Bacillota bacterium]
MDLEDILTINSIPVLENELRDVQESIYNSQTSEEMILLIQREMVIRIRIKQIEAILQS